MVGQHEYVFAAMSGRRPFYPMWFDVARQAYVRLMVWASLCFWVLACTCFVLMFERHKTDIDYNIFRCRYPWRATRARKIDKGVEELDSNSDAYRETKLRTDLELIINMLAIPPAIYTIKKELFSFLHKGILSDEESKAELKEKFKISCKRQRILTNSDGSVRTWLKKSIPDIHDSQFVSDVIKPLEIEELMY
ncbi:hypothetical protein Tco_0481631 [Tanacetum coccineum]